MYDIIKLAIRCPSCGGHIDSCYTFQLERLEETYYPGDLLSVNLLFIYIKGTAKCSNHNCVRTYFDIYIPHYHGVISDKYYYKALEEKSLTWKNI